MKKGKIKNIGYRFDWFSIDFENSVIDPWTKWQGTDCFRGMILCTILTVILLGLGEKHDELMQKPKDETRWRDG